MVYKELFNKSIIRKTLCLLRDTSLKFFFVLIGTASCINLKSYYIVRQLKFYEYSNTHFMNTVSNKHMV